MGYLQTAIILAITAVGLVQFIKNWIPENFPKKLYTLIFALTTFGVTMASAYLPESVSAGLLTLSVGQLGYDNIIQLVNKVISKITDNLKTISKQKNSYITTLEMSLIESKNETKKKNLKVGIISFFVGLGVGALATGLIIAFSK